MGFRLLYAVFSWVWIRNLDFLAGFYLDWDGARNLDSDCVLC